MKLLILGASGPTGVHLVDQALAGGHDVKAFVRDRRKLAASGPRLTVIEGDATRQDQLAAAATGVDAVLSALGSGKSLRSDIASRAAAALIPALAAAGVRRLIFLSAFGVGETFDEASRIQKFFFRTFLRSLYADKVKADAALRASALDWTLVYPVVLTNGLRTGSYRAVEHARFSGMPKISRADVADFMLAQAASTEWVRRTAILSS